MFHPASSVFRQIGLLREITIYAFSSDGISWTWCSTAKEIELAKVVERALEILAAIDGCSFSTRMILGRCTDSTQPVRTHSTRQARYCSSCEIPDYMKYKWALRAGFPGTAHPEGCAMERDRAIPSHVRSSRKLG
jgi:hypothetical protein